MDVKTASRVNEKNGFLPSTLGHGNACRETTTNKNIFQIKLQVVWNFIMSQTRTRKAQGATAQNLNQTHKVYKRCHLLELKVKLTDGISSKLYTGVQVRVEMFIEFCDLDSSCFGPTRQETRLGRLR